VSGAEGETAIIGLLVLMAAREAREWALFVGRRWRIVTATVPKQETEAGDAPAVPSPAGTWTSMTNVPKVPEASPDGGAP
jgi:hypothetical protein